MTAAPVLARTLKYKVTVSKGGNAGQSYSFDKSVVTIGRGPENDLVFSNDPKMSRNHAEIRVHLGQLVVRNLSQKNYILVNGERVEEKTLNSSGTLQAGETLLQIQVEEPPSTSQSVSTATPVLKAVSNSVSVAKPVSQALTKSNHVPAAKPSAPPLQTYHQSPPPPPPNSHSGYANPSSPRARAGADSGRIRFYAIIVVVGLIAYWFLSEGEKPKKAGVPLRSEGDIVRAIEESAKTVQELKKQQSTVGQDTIQYKAAQEHYIKGFRDYRQGQYGRAMQSFQAALSFFPGHELARKYLIQAQRKFEAQVDLNMALGRKYKDRQNYKMCQSAFANVMIMLKDSSKPKYKEAKQYYDECNLRLEGGF